MLGFLGRRLIQLVVTIFAIVTILFFLLRVTGDPAALLLGSNATVEQIASLRQELGLDEPLIVQYLDALRNILVLDFGTSLRSGQDALGQALPRLGISLQLTGYAVGLAFVVAVPVGVYSAARRRDPVARSLMGGTYLAQAIPVYVSGILAVLVFAQLLGWFPTFGWATPRHMVLPIVTLALVPMAKFARLTRSSMGDSLSADYIRTAEAKGLSPLRITVVHALRNSLLAVLTVLGAELGLLVGSAVITESLFAIPGIGRMLVTAALARDYPLVQAGVFLVAVTVVGVNALVDLSYGVLDPRVREGASR